MKKSSDFKPAWWLSNPHLQTIWPTLARSKKKMHFTRERVELKDGDFLDCDWIAKERVGAPIVVVMHGLGGSIDSPYAPGTLEAIKKSGWRGVLMHFRGCSGEHNRLERSYHAADTSDLSEFIQHLKDSEPGVPIAAVGYSLGGNVLLKWLGETGKKNKLVAAVAISVPFDLAQVLERFGKGFSRFYSKFLLQQLRDNVIDKFSGSYAPINLDNLKKAETFSDFDNAFTAPLHGFANSYDYYQRASSIHYLKTICIPTLILHAEDDPFMTQGSIPDDADLSEDVTLEISPKGGHVGFVAGRWPWQPQYWLEERIPSFLRPHFESRTLAEAKC